MDERLKQQLSFCLEIDKEKSVFRQTSISGGERKENDAEHAWHMAVMAYLLREYANEPVDISRVMLMCLIHDIVEIDAGDTYCYDTDAMLDKKQREDAAKNRIYALLPDDQREELTALFEEFEENVTPEARFAHTIDNLQPVLLNDSNDGADWKEHGICEDQVLARQMLAKQGSEPLFHVIKSLIERNVRQGNLKAAGHLKS